MLCVLFSLAHDHAQQSSFLVLGQRHQLYQCPKPNRPRAYSQSLSKSLPLPCRTIPASPANRGKFQHGVATAAQNPEQLEAAAHGHMLLQYSLLSGTSLTASSDVVRAPQQPGASMTAFMHSRGTPNKMRMCPLDSG